ncbi:MAG: hypothetical protein HQK83_18605 [Fibrobacteria bacterium]|nr:hypothetical protein [Fibrobacteria bacterium]
MPETNRFKKISDEDLKFREMAQDLKEKIENTQVLTSQTLAKDTKMLRIREIHQKLSDILAD